MVILLVEDDKPILDIWVECVQSLGYDFWTAMHTEAAIGFFDIDLVITDLRIPVAWGRMANAENGMKVIEHYRNKGVPVIVASSDIHGYKDRILNLGAKIADDKSIDAIVMKIGG